LKNNIILGKLLFYFSFYNYFLRNLVCSCT